MARTRHALNQLPLLDDTWLIGTPRLRTWVKEKGAKLVRPYLILIASSGTGLVCGSDIVKAPPTASQVRDVLFKTMQHPPRELGKACRPRALALGDHAMVEPLHELLAQAGLEADVLPAEFSDEFYDIVRDLEEHLRGGVEDQPAMLDVSGVTPELLRGVYAAAAEFYRAAPWVQLSNYQVLAVRHPREGAYRYALVMGQGGVEYGVMRFAEWSQVERQFTQGDNPMSALPAGGLHSLFYDTADRVPFADLDAIEQYDLEIAAPDAYPIAVVVEGRDQVRRPTREEWEWYEAALRAIPIVVREYLHPNARGDYEPMEMKVAVDTHAGTMEVGVKYPAGEIALGDQPVEWLDWPEAKEDETEGRPVFDRRAMEGTMFQLTRELGGQAEPDDPALARAQDLMYRAWEQTNPAKRIALAHDALALSPNCADAYVLLAEEEADTLNRALELYQRGIEAGERALGAKYFKRNAGHFWGLLETRPYMRAREGLARTLWRLKRYEQAIAHYRELLRLNPGDNQGIRYALLDLLLQLERDEEARMLLNQYRDEWSALWLYSRALLEFRAHGASARANKILRDAREENPYVPAYLIGEKRVPNRRLDSYGWGDESEAIYYASEHLNYWRRTPGAVEWLHAEAQAQPARKKSAAHPPPRKPVRQIPPIAGPKTPQSGGRKGKRPGRGR